MKSKKDPSTSNAKNSVPSKPISKRPTLAAFAPILPKKEQVQVKAPRRVKKQEMQSHRIATARQCPLVLDGEISAVTFSPESCQCCEEFDCVFCDPEARGSGALRSHLFAPDESGEEDDNWGNPIDPETDEPVKNDTPGDSDGEEEE